MSGTVSKACKQNQDWMMKTSTTLLVYLIVWFIPRVGFAQFVDITTQSGIVNQITSSFGSDGVSFYDFNGDGWDDLTVTTGGPEVLFYLNVGGMFVETDLGITAANNGFVSMVLWADVNNNGYADLLITRFFYPVELWLNNGDMTFTNFTLASGLLQHYASHTGAAFCDYNKDGCLDLFIAKFESDQDFPNLNKTCVLYQGNCDGTFEDVTMNSGIGMVQAPVFQPVFFDINNNGWEDLFLVVDKFDYPNRLYLNNGDGSFTEISEESGMGLHFDAMSGAIADYNHNGFFDIVVTDTGDIHLFENQGEGSFTPLGSESGLEITSTGWGTIWMDVDNIGNEDLIVHRSTAQPFPQGGYFFRNHTNGLFTDMSDEYGLASMQTEGLACAMGDVNNDGYPDFFVQPRPPFQSKLMQNIPKDNNFLSVTLQGTYSNRDAVGSLIVCYTGEQIMRRYVQSGDDFVRQNSMRRIFGLGQNQVIDSLEIRWSRGLIEKYYNLEVNQHLHLIEGASLPFAVYIDASSDDAICPGDSVILSAGNHHEFLWSDGSTGSEITVFENGAYWVEVFNEYGFSAASDTFHVFVAPITLVEVIKSDVSCSGASDGAITLEFNTGEPQEINWSNGGSGSSISNLSGGVYSFEGLDSAGCFVQGATSIYDPPPLQTNLQISNVKCFGESSGQAALAIDGGTPPYSIEWMGANPDSLPVGEYSVLLTDSKGCDAWHDFSISQPDSIDFYLFMMSNTEDAALTDVGISVWGGTPPYTVNWSTDDSGFILWGVGDGDYSVSVMDANDCQKEKTFAVEGPSSVEAGHSGSWSVFPNPARDFINITGPFAGEYGFRLLDASGRQVKHGALTMPETILEIADLAAGTYFLEVSGNSETYRYPLLIIGR